MPDTTRFKDSSNTIKISDTNISFSDQVGTTFISESTNSKTEVDLNRILLQSKNPCIIAKGDVNDVVASAIALALFFKSKYQVTPTVIYLGDTDAIDYELKDLCEIKPELEKVKLKIELDYNGTEIESCEWYKDETEKKLVFEINPIHKGFGTKRIKFKEVGLEFDLIVTIGLSKMADLGDIYDTNKNYFETVNTINIDNYQENTKFGKTNIIDTTTEYISKIVFDLFIELKFVPDINISKCLLKGLSSNAK